MLTIGNFGRCDSCGSTCDSSGCTNDRGHEIANDRVADVRFRIAAGTYENDNRTSVAVGRLVDSFMEQEDAERWDGMS